jgi:hypothetical protein
MCWNVVIYIPSHRFYIYRLWWGGDAKADNDRRMGNVGVGILYAGVFEMEMDLAV